MANAPPLSVTPTQTPPAHVSLATRARTRPVLYPTAFLVAFVLNLVVATQVSPYAAGRALAIALVVGLGVPWAAGLVTGDRHLAGIVGGAIALAVLSPPSPLGAGLVLVVLVAVVILGRAIRDESRHRESAVRRLPLVTRTLTGISAITLVAVGVNAVQQGRAVALLGDLVSELPIRAAQSGPDNPSFELPDMYLVLLDGYPRADKLRSELGIEISGFTRGLETRGFAVAARSRSNHATTRLTLMQLFDYAASAPPPGTVGGEDLISRRKINDGRFLADARGAGYAIVAISPGWEHVALRRADRFVDPGPVNDFELALLGVTGFGAVVDAAFPTLFGDAHRARALGALEALERLAGEADVASPRFIFGHLAVPHPPLVFAASGDPFQARDLNLSFKGIEEIRQLGWPEYIRRYEAQLAYLNGRILGLVDAIVGADPDAVVIVFSDHGLAVSPRKTEMPSADPDLRTANLLAVRSPGRSGIIDDRSTLVNLLPRLLRAYAGRGPADRAETIYGGVGYPAPDSVFVRPD
jgi:hypothetical protein